MRKIFTILFIITVTNLYSQNDTSEVMISIPASKVIEAAKKLKDCRNENTKYELLVSELKLYSLMQDTIIQNSADALNKKDIEIASYRKALGDYGVQDGKLVWHKRRDVNFIFGILTGGSLVYLGTRIFSK
jgi:hypothetical protein